MSTDALTDDNYWDTSSFAIKRTSGTYRFDDVFTEMDGGMWALGSGASHSSSSAWSETIGINFRRAMSDVPVVVACYAELGDEISCNSHGSASAGCKWWVWPNTIDKYGFQSHGITGNSRYWNGQGFSWISAVPHQTTGSTTKGTAYSTPPVAVSTSGRTLMQTDNLYWDLSNVRFNKTGEMMNVVYEQIDCGSGTMSVTEDTGTRTGIGQASFSFSRTFKQVPAVVATLNTNIGTYTNAGSISICAYGSHPTVNEYGSSGESIVKWRSCTKGYIQIFNWTDGDINVGYDWIAVARAQD